MTLPTWITLAGLLLLFLGERIFGTNELVRYVLSGTGLVSLLIAVGLRAKGLGPGWKHVASRQLTATIAVLAGVALYWIGSDLAVDALGFEDEGAQRWSVAFGALWPIVVALGLVPMMLVDRAATASVVPPHPQRVRQALGGSLTAVLAIALLFPLNYMAHEFNKRWDVTYFRTTAPGTATQALVDNLDEPIRAVLFFATSSDVAREVVPYFEALAGPNLQVEVADHALEPVLAKELKVRDNGVVALVKGEGDDQQSEKVKVGTDIDKARRTLKKLDSEVQKALLGLARGTRVAYFTVGHGEMEWRGQHGADRKLSLLKKLLEAFNYDVKTLGIGEGLASAVPDDASIVFIMGPDARFLPEEAASLVRYKEAGGSVLLALEPGQEEEIGLQPLLDALGLVYHDQLLVTDDAKTYLPITGGVVDRQNLGTNSYSSHQSVSTLSKNRRQAWMVLPGTGWLEEAETHGGKVTTTVRTLSKVWADMDGDFEFDKDDESREVRDLAVVASGPSSGDDEYRAVVVGDAGFASDLLLPNKANAQFLVDASNWLLREEEITGTVNDEEDIKIVHNKEGQGIWFYGTTFLVPIGLALLGFVRVRSRRRSAANNEKEAVR